MQCRLKPRFTKITGCGRPDAHFRIFHYIIFISHKLGEHNKLILSVSGVWLLSLFNAYILSNDFAF